MFKFEQNLLSMKIGILREGKTPPDKRVPLSPEQCKWIIDNKAVSLVVQSSPIRKFKDSDYRSLGVEVVEDVLDCDILLGVKEVPESDLIAGKHYFFFSHTYKKQPYNRALLQTILAKKVKLTDWEMIEDKSGKRLIAFGRYAGIVGCYNAFYAYGEKTGAFSLKRAESCEDRVELEKELKKVILPANYKIVITGMGRVAHGAEEIVKALGLKKVSPSEFKAETFKEAVYTQLSITDYNKPMNGSEFDKSLFYEDASSFESAFMDYSGVAQMYIACHFWDSSAPFIYTREDCKHKDWTIDIVADISCDIDGPVASTLRPSTIADPLYGYDPTSEQEVAFDAEGAITVMAVDNLPCELPKDASVAFGQMFLDHVLEPLLGNDPDNIIDRASETNFEGKLSPKFAYLQSYVDGE